LRRCFIAETHRNALRDPHTAPDAKTRFSVTCPNELFMETAPGPPENEKSCVDISCPRCTEMPYVTRGSHRMQKHKFVVTCPDAHFVQSVTVPPEHDKYCVDVSWLRCTGMHYMTRRSHWTQKHKFGIMCLCVLFVEPVRSHLSMKNSASTFHAPDAPECSM
jgi:hypothetical protein